MFNCKNFEYDCSRKCRLSSHGNAITAALTKRSIDDQSLAAYVAKTCCNFADIVDDLGRSAVHASASVDRYNILEWLLNQGAIINGRDFESGSTPLHRALFYGCIDCAVLLMRYGACLDALDEDTRTPLQQICRFCDCPKKQSVPPSNELLVWGTNKNYNLGISNDQSSDMPLMLDYFRKEQISIKMVALGAYHSLFLDKKGNIFSVGHGKGGRLGNGNENSLSTPKKVKLTFKNEKEEVVDISVSRKHSLVLTNRSLVFACGLNQESQLGVRDAGEKLLNFKEVIALRDYGVDGLKKVIAKDQYSLAYSESCIYIWGTNLGQMGIDANTKTVPVPKMMKIPPKTVIQFVEANNGATVVVTKENTILLFHNYKMRVIKAPNYENLKSVAVVEGDNTKSEKGTASALKLLILTQTNVVFLWYQLTQNFYRCSFSNVRLRQIDKILYKGNYVLILSEGDVYRGKCQQVALPPYYNSCEKSSQPKDLGNIWSRNNRASEMATDFMIRIELQQIVQIDRAVEIYTDEDFTSFAVLQESFLKYFKLPALNPEEYTFKKLYNEVSECDAVHDVVFHVDGEKFPAHKLLIKARADGLLKCISSCEDKDVHLNFENLTGKIFEIIMKFIYTNYLPNEQDLQDIQRSIHAEAPTELEDVCELFLNFVEQFNISNLAKYLKSFMQQQPFHLPHIPDKSKHRFTRLKHSDFSDMYDVRIVCENNMELQAHKCVLVARLEYFEMMFSHAWAEQATINLVTVPYEYMEAIVSFLYNLDVEHFRKQQYRESFLYNMIVFCDQFFIERLRRVCEILLLDRISIRKCGEMLDFATMYNCEVMQRGCLDFICQNLSRILFQKSLNNCEPEVIRHINGHYREMFKDVIDYRIITPDTEAVDDDCLNSFVEDFQVDLSYRMTEEEQLKYGVLNKSKVKECSSKRTSTRQYEREAISAMLESLNISDAMANSKNDDKLSKLKATQDVATKLQADAKPWMTVPDKKDQKKKNSLDHALNANNILKSEASSDNAFTKLNRSEDGSPFFALKTPEKEMDFKSVFSKTYNVNLADISTPAREKMSQKQRKRLSSESNSMTSWRSPTSVGSDTPNGSQPVNAWKTVAQSPSDANGYDYDAATGSSQDPTSFANMIKTNKTCTSPSNSNSFSQILEEEKRQRENYERVRNKSLALTQIEEQAIAELKQFYNVDNLTDEIITIERKTSPLAINFAIWQRH